MEKLGVKWYKKSDHNFSSTSFDVENCLANMCSRSKTESVKMTT